MVPTPRAVRGDCRNVQGPSLTSFSKYFLMSLRSSVPCANSTEQTKQSKKMRKSVFMGRRLTQSLGQFNINVPVLPSEMQLCDQSEKQTSVQLRLPNE